MLIRWNNIADDDDITPYATFTLKPICGMDTSRSLMSVPSIRAPDSHSSNSIEGDELFIKRRRLWLWLQLDSFSLKGKSIWMFLFLLCSRCLRSGWTSSDPAVRPQRQQSSNLPSPESFSGAALPAHIGHERFFVQWYVLDQERLLFQEEIPQP